MAYHPYMRRGNEKGSRRWFAPPQYARRGNTALPVPDPDAAPLVIFDSHSRFGGPVALTPGSQRAQRLPSAVTLLADHPLLERTAKFYDNLVGAGLPVGVTLRQAQPELSAAYRGPCGQTKDRVPGEVTLLRLAGPRGAAIFRCTLRHAQRVGALLVKNAVTVEFNAPRSDPRLIRTRLVATAGSEDGLRTQLTGLADFTGTPYALARFTRHARAVATGWTDDCTAGGRGSVEGAYYNQWRTPIEAAPPPTGLVVQRSWALPELSRRHAAPKAG